MKKNFHQLIGVIHLPPLLGAPVYPRGSESESGEQTLNRAGRWAFDEARRLEKAGFTDVVLENFGDAPFYKDQVPPETIASMAILCAAVREAAPRLQVGVNVLRNDARGALAIATAAGCQWIRVNVLSGVFATDQGIIESQAALLLRERDRLRSVVKIYADVHVKHARSLSSDDLQLATEELIGRGQADAVIVTGSTTGRAADVEHVVEVKRIARAHHVPVLLGSGSRPENISDYLNEVDGFIVGSALRKNGVAGTPLDSSRVSRWMQSYRRAASRSRKQKK